MERHLRPLRHIRQAKDVMKNSSMHNGTGVAVPVLPAETDPLQRDERVQFGRARIREQPVPRLGSDPRHAAQPAVGCAEAERPLETREVGQQIADTFKDQTDALNDEQVPNPYSTKALLTSVSGSTWTAEPGWSKARMICLLDGSDGGTVDTHLTLHELTSQRERAHG